MLLNVSLRVAVLAVVQVSVNLDDGNEFRRVIGELKYFNVIHGPSFRRSVPDGDCVVVEVAVRVVAFQELDLGAGQDVLEDEVSECVFVEG